MYWLGQVLNLFIAGVGYITLPKGKRLLGLVFFLVWFFWALFGDVIVGWEFSSIGTFIINISSMFYFHNIWNEK